MLGFAFPVNGFSARAFAEELNFRQKEAARVLDWAAKKKGGVTVPECRDHLNGLEAQKIAVEKMTGS